MTGYIITSPRRGREFSLLSLAPPWERVRVRGEIFSFFAPEYFCQGFPTKTSGKHRLMIID